MKIKKLIIREKTIKYKIKNINRFLIPSIENYPIKKMDKLKTNIVNLEYCVLTSKL